MPAARRARPQAPPPRGDPPANAPAATLEELAERRYAALNAEDNEALLALNAVGALHFDYLVEGPAGVVHRSFLVAEHDATSEDQAVEVLGEPIVSGNTVAVPVRYRYSCGVATGFDVLAAERTASGGLLIARSATHYAARPAAGVNPAVVQDLIAAQTAAWTAGDVDGVLATYGENAAYIEVLTGYVYTGGTLRSFFADRSLEFTGPPVISGSFVAVPTRTTDRGTGLAEDGVSIYWIRDGKIVLHSYAQGA